MPGLSPRRWLSAGASARPDAPALTGAVRLTYAELAERVARWSPAPAPAPGRAAAIPVREAVATIVRLWAAWEAGAVAHPHDGRHPPLHLPDVGHEGAHTIVRTSGTSGRPRGVVLTEGNVAAAAAASRARLGTGAGDRWLLVLPLFHVGGLSVLWRSAAAGGAVVAHPAFDPAAVAGALRSGEATVASLVPVMLHRVLDADPGPYPGPLVLLGGAAAPAALIERGLDAGLRVLASYGLTEACSQVATVAPGEERKALGTAGRPVDGMRVEIGEGGRIAIDGPAVSPGYAGEPARRGPLPTADVGRFDGAGRLVVLGRADDVIVTGGENVHPLEVEELLARHPDVAEVAVFGLPDPVWGQRVAAAVVPKAGRTLDGAAVAAWLASRAPGYLVPRAWRAVDELPRNRAGKVDRGALAEPDVAQEGL